MKFEKCSAVFGYIYGPQIPIMKIYWNVDKLQVIMTKLYLRT
jgi:hypothetical protein